MNPDSWSRNFERGEDISNLRFGGLGIRNTTGSLWNNRCIQRVVLMCGCCIGIQLNWNYWDTVLHVRLGIRKIVSHKFQCWCWRSCQQTICLVRFHNHWFLRCFSKSNYCFSISIIKKRYLCSSKRIKIFSFSSLCYFQTWGDSEIKDLVSLFEDTKKWIL